MLRLMKYDREDVLRASDADAYELHYANSEEPGRVAVRVRIDEAIDAAFLKASPEHFR